MAQQEKNYTTKKVKYSNFDILLELKKYPHERIKVEHLKYIHDFGKNAEYWYGKGNLRLTASSLRLLGEDLICIILNIENLDSTDLLNFTEKQELQSIEFEAMLRFFKQRTNLSKEVINDLYMIKNTGNEGTHFHSAQNLTEDSVKKSLLKSHEFVFSFFRQYSTKPMAAFEKTPQFIFPNKKGEIWKEVHVNSNQGNRQFNENVQLNKNKEEIKLIEGGEQYFFAAEEYYKNGNYSEAFVLLQKAAEMGHIDAQNKLAYCYTNSEGVEQNYEEAAKWYRKAAEQGNSDAQCSLGISYTYGEGVEQNYEEAAKWYRKAAEQGNSVAQYNLGVSYTYGEGVEQNHEEAAKWYRKAAEQGYSSAQYRLGMCYQNAHGVEKDDEEAFEWYKKAGSQGHTDAQYHLGMYYYKGKAVKRNYYEAMKWFEKAAYKDHTAAQYYVGVFYEKGLGVDRDYKEALKWFEKAASKNYAAAQNSIGIFYTEGLGVDSDFDEAMKWSVLAYENGYKEAKNNIELLERCKKHIETRKFMMGYIKNK